MSRFVTGNVFLGLSMAIVTVAHVMIKRLLDEMQMESFAWTTVQQFMTPGRVLRGGVAGLLVVAGFILWLLCLSRLDLSYAYPIASCSVLLITLFSVIFLGETVTWRVWVGSVLILVGIILLRPESP